MTAFPINSGSGLPAASRPLDQTISLNSLGVEFRVPVAGYGRFSATFEGNIGTGVVEMKKVLGGGPPVSYSPVKVFNSSTASVEQIDVAGISEIVFEVTTADSGESITIYTFAEAY